MSFLNLNNLTILSVEANLGRRANIFICFYLQEHF